MGTMSFINSEKGDYAYNRYENNSECPRQLCTRVDCMIVQELK